MDNSEKHVLDKLRTLLAMERNFLAEERTFLAEFRTGLTLALIVPPASAVISYILSPLAFSGELAYNLFVLAFLVILTVLGVRMTLRSHSKLRYIAERKKKLKNRQIEIIKRSRVAHDLLGDLVRVEEEID